MVIAGPGSGKTHVIAQRLRFMIEYQKIPPESILVITFTKAAALEMQRRFFKITDSSYPGVTFGTFHSIFYMILRRSNSTGDPVNNIATEVFKREIIRDILSSLYAKSVIDREHYEDSLKETDLILSEMSRLKNSCLTAVNCNPMLSVKSCFDMVMKDYSRRMDEFGKLDFDDMCLKCHELLSGKKEVMKIWQERFKYILIDEYQDINPMQFKIIRLLLGNSGNLFVVGDDDQSIYGFRGSDPSIMMNFTDEFAAFDPKVIRLDINYRSDKRIIDTADAVIRENSERLEKETKAGNLRDNSYVKGLSFKDKKSQDEAVAELIARDNVKGTAVLYRTNTQCRAMAGLLASKGIESNISSAADSCKSFLEDPAVRLVMDYLKFACLGRNRSDFVRIMNIPQRYITRESLCREVVTEKDVLKFYSENPVRKKTIKLLFKQIEMVKNLRPCLAVKYLRDEVGLGSIYKGSASNLDALRMAAKECDNNRQFLEKLAELEENQKENNERNRKKRKNSNDGVTIMTYHGCKGLEFDRVILPDLNEGIIPSRSAENGSQTEEERRMLYVAMTRARSALVMSYVEGTKENPMLPSRFLRPLRYLWESEKSSQSSPSSGRSTSSSNSTSSRNSSKASDTISYSSSSLI